jgi:ribosome-associated toxin RatA of RatAB toxin-antitoxin module
LAKIASRQYSFEHGKQEALLPIKIVEFSTDPRLFKLNLLFLSAIYCKTDSSDLLRNKLYIMTVIKKSALVQYQPEQMYNLIDHVENYPQFLPWCKETTVHSRTEDEVRASLSLSWSGIQKTFTTCNRLQKNKMIEVRLVEGPFRHLEGFWLFEPLADQGCKVILDLEFEFSGKWMSMVFGPIFQQVANSLVDAFCNQAVVLYGEK